MDFNKPKELSLEGNVAENWRKFKQNFNLFLEASEKVDKPSKLKVAIFLNLIGEDALEVYNTFKLSEEDSADLDKIIQKFDEFCEPKKNEIFERFNFFSRKQGENEGIDSFVTDLKKLAKSCNFGDQQESLIRDRLVIGVKSKPLQERLLRESNLTLEKSIELCKAEELSKMQLQAMQKPENVDVLKRKIEKNKYLKKEERSEDNTFKCKRCGKSHKLKQCPAWGKKCAKCHRMNHFAEQCRSNKIKSVNKVDEENKMWVINQDKTVNTLEWKKSISVNGKSISFKLDSGAEVNVLPFSITKKMRNVQIKTTDRKISSYTGHEIKIKGIATLECKTQSKKEDLDFFIADGYYQPVLGVVALEKLSLVQRVCDAVHNMPANTATEILKCYEDVFQGVGKLPIQHKISLKEDARPTVASSRKIPFSLKEKVKDELESMEKKGIIQKIEKPTEWVHPIVIVHKSSGQVRICMDPRELNKYIKREQYTIPTAESIFGELNGAKIFSVLDASTAFWQIPLDEQSSQLCTITTPFGRYQFKRLPYGLNSASEVFQRSMHNILADLQGVACYMDDILIFGSDMKDHNQKLEAVFERLRKFNVKLSKNKLQIAVDKVNYLGHVISSEGIAIQESKVEAIQKLKAPQNKTELQRFLGMITYLAKFIPNLSEKTASIRKLISKKTEWKWGQEQQECYENLKTLIQSAPVLKFYDPNKPTTISTDASQFGIGIVVMQEGHPIEYASFSLNETQKKYAQIEKELLALVLGCERFHYYLYGTDFEAETDHKPLLSIVKKPLENLSPRLQRMVLRLMRYRVNLKYTQGKKMFIADHLSRDPTKQEFDTSYLEGHAESVHMILTTTDDKIMRLKRETKNDKILNQLSVMTRIGWPKYKSEVNDEVKPYWQFKEEIHESEGILYRGDRVVIPTSLRKEILQVIHMSHQGIVASKNKARQCFYWPGMMVQIEEEVSKCRTCQEYARKNPEEMKIPHEIPKFPWEKVATDFMQVEGVNYLLLVDYHSKFVEVRRLINKKEADTISKLQSIFRTHGIPRTLVSDNGPPFDSAGFQKFARDYEFEHVTSSPGYPKSNGQVERAIQSAKGLIIKALKSKRDPNLALMEFNNTPRSDLPSPTQMLMGRSIRTMSTYTSQQLEPLFNTTKSKEQLEKRQQMYAGKPSRKLEPFEVGQPVMVQKKHRQWTPATVVAKHESPRSYMVKTTGDRRVYRRNRIHLRQRKFDVSESEDPNSFQQEEGRKIVSKEPEPGDHSDNGIHQEPTNYGVPSDDPLEIPETQRTRSGRLVRKPERYRD